MATKAAVRALRAPLSVRTIAPLFAALQAPLRFPHSSSAHPQFQTCPLQAFQRNHVSRSFSTTSTRAILPSVDDKFKSRSVHDLLSLKGKTIIITGGGRGIGLALGRGCVEAGGNLAVLDALVAPHEDYDELKKEYPDAKIEFYQTDVTNLEKLTQTYNDVVKDFGSIDGCITAAGIVLSKPFIEHGWDETLRVEMVNNLGTFFSAQLAAKQMIAQNAPGSIVLISSITAHHSASNQPVSAYAATKGAVLSLMKALAVELAPHQIRVNSISPGHIWTDMLASLGVADPQLVQRFEGDPPLKRTGNRLDLKLPVVHLLSDGCAYTTGSDLLITGGLHLERAI